MLKPNLGILYLHISLYALHVRYLLYTMCGFYVIYLLHVMHAPYVMCALGVLCAFYVNTRYMQCCVVRGVPGMQCCVVSLETMEWHMHRWRCTDGRAATHATLKVHNLFFEASPLRSSIRRPKTDFDFVLSDE